MAGPLFFLLGMIYLISLQGDVVFTNEKEIPIPSTVAPGATTSSPPLMPDTCDEPLGFVSSCGKAPEHWQKFCDRFDFADERPQLTRANSILVAMKIVFVVGLVVDLFWLAPLLSTCAFPSKPYTWQVDHPGLFVVSLLFPDSVLSVLIGCLAARIHDLLTPSFSTDGYLDSIKGSTTCWASGMDKALSDGLLAMACMGIVGGVIMFCSALGAFANLKEENAYGRGACRHVLPIHHSEKEKLDFQKKLRAEKRVEDREEWYQRQEIQRTKNREERQRQLAEQEQRRQQRLAEQREEQARQRETQLAHERSRVELRQQQEQATAEQVRLLKELTGQRPALERVVKLQKIALRDRKTLRKFHLTPSTENLPGMGVGDGGVSAVGTGSGTAAEASVEMAAHEQVDTATATAAEAVSSCDVGQGEGGELGVGGQTSTAPDAANVNVHVDVDAGESGAAAGGGGAAAELEELFSTEFWQVDDTNDNASLSLGHGERDIYVDIGGKETEIE